MRITIFIFALSTLLFSCKKDPLSGIDVIRFSYSNAAWGVVCDRYELTPDHLKTTDAPCGLTTDSVALVYNIELGEDKKTTVSELLNSIPEDFFTRPDFAETSNCCLDCGGYFIEVIKDGKSRTASFTHTLCDPMDKSDKKLFGKVIEAVEKLRK